MSSSAASRSAGAGYRPALAALVIADVAFAFQQTAVVPVIPVIERALGIAPTWGAWLLSGYLLVSTVAAPVLGRLADRRGRRAVLLIALGVFLAGSLGAAAAPDAPVLILFRAVQGVGGAVFPLSLSIAREELPAERVAFANGLLTAAFGVGTAVGFAAAGALTAALTWRLVFLAGAVVVAGAIPAVRRWVPRRPGPSGGGVDLPGGALLGAALALLLVALTVAPQQRGAGWVLPGVLLTGSAAAGRLWLRHERTAPEPLVDRHTLRSRTELWTNAATLAVGYAVFGLYYLLPRFVEDPRQGFGAAPSAVGLYLLPVAVGQLLAAPAVRRVQGRGSPRRPFGLGLAAMAAGAGGYALGGGSSLTAFCVSGFLLGCGAGLAIGAAGALASLGADEEHTGVATSLNSTVRRVAGGIGSQVSAAVLIAVGTGASGWATAFGLACVVCLAAVPAAALVPLHGGGHRGRPERSADRAHGRPLVGEPSDEG